MTNMGRLPITIPMGLLMLELNLGKLLGINALRGTPRSPLLTAGDCREILRFVPRVGRTAMALRRRTAKLLKELEGE